MKTRLFWHPRIQQTTPRPHMEPHRGEEAEAEACNHLHSLDRRRRLLIQKLEGGSPEAVERILEAAEHVAFNGDYLGRLKTAHAHAVDEFPKLAAPDGKVAIRIDDLGYAIKRLDALRL